MVQSLHEISTKALMQRIADELEGLIVADAEGRYAYVNQRWSSLTGYTFEQVKGRYVRDVVRLSRVDEVLKTQKFVSGDAILLNSQTGEEVPVYCSYTPLFHENKLEGCLVYMIRKNEDVSLSCRFTAGRTESPDATASVLSAKYRRSLGSDCRKQPGDSENEARNCLCSAVLFHGFD